MTVEELVSILLQFPLDGTVSFEIKEGEVKIRVDRPKKKAKSVVKRAKK
jgi:hypothetical protein